MLNRPRVRNYIVSVMSKLFAGILLSLVSAVAVSAQAADGIVINRLPLRDLAKNAGEKVAQKKVDLRKPFSITVNGSLTPDGKIDLKKTKIKVNEGSDEAMANLAKEAIIAISDSGSLAYLTWPGGRPEFSANIGQNGSAFWSDLTMNFDTEVRADSFRSSVDLIVSLAISRLDEKKQLDLSEQNDLTLLKNVKVAANGNTVTLAISLPNDLVEEMIKQQLPAKAN